MREIRFNQAQNVRSMVPVPFSGGAPRCALKRREKGDSVMRKGGREKGDRHRAASLPGDFKAFIGTEPVPFL